MTHLTPRFEDALAYAARLHANQRRKGTEIPYVSHLLAVASLALEGGADEDTAIAALLHDAVEDCGGAPILEAIRERFGNTVADTVMACSDSDTFPKPPWRERKTRYLAHLADTSTPALLVSLCDKLHNARCLLRDLGTHGNALWERFNARPEDLLWYYRSLAEAFEARKEVLPADILADLIATVKALEEKAALDLGGQPQGSPL